MPTRLERDMRDERVPSQRDERLRRYWDKHAGSYDREMGFFDRHVFGDTRDWVCFQAVGEVLEESDRCRCECARLALPYVDVGVLGFDAAMMEARRHLLA